MFGSLNPWVVLGGGLAAILLVSAIFFMGRDYGASKTTMKYQEQEIVQLEQDLVEEKRITEQLLKFQEGTEQASQDAQRNVIERTNTITEVQYRNRDVIQEVFRDTPYLSEGWVYAHDAISKGEDVDPIKASDRNPSNFTEADSLRVIGNNYANKFQTDAQVESWNIFYDGVRAANNSLQPTERTDSVDSSGSGASGGSRSSDSRAEAP